MRNNALNGTFVFLSSHTPPANNVFQVVKLSALDRGRRRKRGANSCDVSHRLWLSHKRRSDPSEQVPRDREGEGCCRSQGHIHTFTITMRGVEGCPPRIRTAQQRGHTHRACTHSYLHSVRSFTCTQECTGPLIFTVAFIFTRNTAALRQELKCYSQQFWYLTNQLKVFIM